jgi:hypothetical protein
VPAATFGIDNDKVTGGGDMAPGQVKTVEVTFTPAVAGTMEGTLIVTATNLTVPKAMRLSGTGT